MRTPGSSRETTWPVIRRVGIELLHEHGFERMSLRQLASAAELQTGSLYNYFDTKQAFLFRIVCDVIEEVLADAQAAIAPLDDPVEQLEEFVQVLVAWHTERRKETFIAVMDVRSLEPEEYLHYHNIRANFDLMLTEILDAGKDQGRFAIVDSGLVAIGIMSLLTNICRWYRPDGRLTADVIAERYTEMVLAMVSAKKTTRRSGQTRSAAQSGVGKTDR